MHEEEVQREVTVNGQDREFSVILTFDRAIPFNWKDEYGWETTSFQEQVIGRRTTRAHSEATLLFEILESLEPNQRDHLCKISLQQCLKQGQQPLPWLGARGYNHGKYYFGEEP